MCLCSCIEVPASARGTIIDSRHGGALLRAEGQNLYSCDRSVRVCIAENIAQ